MTDPNPAGEADREIRALYSRLIEAWDKRNAREYALQFASDALLVGFDGSQVKGQLGVGAHATDVFTHHQTPRSSRTPRLHFTCGPRMARSSRRTCEPDCGRAGSVSKPLALRRVISNDD